MYTLTKILKNNNKDHKQSPKDIRKRGQPTQKYLASFSKKKKKKI